MHPFASAIEGTHALGQVRECTVVVGGKPGTTRETCTDYGVGRAIAWRIDADSPGFSGMVTDWRSGFRLNDDGGGTVVTAWSNFRPKWFVWPLLPVIRRKFQQTQQEILKGWPLYTYLGDADPGHAAGQGNNDDGGDWYAMRPSGQILGR